MQCLLSLNMYTEKFYTFFWFCMFFVLSMSVGDLLLWFFRFKCAPGLVIQALRDQEENPFAVKQFTKNYLKNDGILIFCLILLETDPITFRECVEALFEYWSRPDDEESSAKDSEAESSAEEPEADEDEDAVWV